jgi:hypothetical protein
MITGPTRKTNDCPLRRAVFVASPLILSPYTLLHSVPFGPAEATISRFVGPELTKPGAQNACRRSGTVYLLHVLIPPRLSCIVLCLEWQNHHVLTIGGDPLSNANVLGIEVRRVRR